MEIKPSYCTFILGNGFDLSLGMKTRYKDMYSLYVKSNSLFETEPEKNWIEKFKNYIKSDKPEYDTWSDFELALGRYSQKCNSSRELVLCERDFKLFLRFYLKSEEEKMMKIINQLQREYIWDFSNFCHFFYQRNDLTEDEKAIISKYRNNTSNFYLSFNYTQRVLKTIIPNDHPIFIHGTLDNDIVLGIDNENQVSLSLDIEAKQAIIKPVYNKTVDSNKLAKIKRVLNFSKIICSFGLSFGESDLTWIKEISNHLLNNDCIWIHYFYLEREFLYFDLIESLNKRNKLKEDFLRKIGVPREIYNKIKEKVFIFPTTKSPFNFPKQP